jgi:nicotinate phosphoribosyltransferase
MSILGDVYRPSLALLTDLYQLTMAYGYWKSGTADKEAVFHLFFRKNPFGGGFAVACGLHRAMELLERFRFEPEDVEYLAGVPGRDGRPIFERAFLDHLRGLRLRCDLDAMPEGTVAFPFEPLLRVRGPILEAQLLETALLNVLNFETLIATKAARVCLAARGEPVLEFGLRRAQGIDGGLSSSRAAYVGGCVGTSNVLAGRLYGIPVRGTHAHSWVMSFETEKEAFQAYADALPNNCVFLVDTYDTLEGVRQAVEVGRRLREGGHEMIGVRLDSGDLAFLSGQARRILDAGGFPGAVILASNDLDEHVIASLEDQGAQIGAWGVGTQLATGGDQPALGGVYKLGAIRETGGDWRHVLKVSEQVAKVSNPGIQQVRRYGDGGQWTADVVWDELLGMPEPSAMVDPQDPTRRKALPAGPQCVDLLVPVFRQGRRVYDPPALPAVRDRVQAQLAGFHPGVKRFLNPHQYPVGLEGSLHDLKTRLVLAQRGVVA